MKERCLNPGHISYKSYGAKGVLICDKWRDSFEAFLSDVGKKPEPGMTLGRTGDQGNYEPGNAFWQSDAQQAAARRGDLHDRFTIRGVARSEGISRSTLRKRLALGWTMEDAINTPIDRRFRAHGCNK
jgi:hypothetical protein